MRAFIDDGYTRTVGIREIDGLMPAVEWTYRPLAGPEQSDAYTTILMSADKTAAKIDLLLDRISQWRFPSSEDASGDWGQPEASLLKRLNASAFAKIEQTVLGTGAPDYEIVDAAEAPALSDVDQSGPDAKNSQAG